MMVPFLTQSTERLTLVLTKTVIVSKVDFVCVHGRSHAILTFTLRHHTSPLLIVDRSGERIFTGQSHIVARLRHFLETPGALRVWLWSDGNL
jgi:hypothetical protein